MKRTRSITASVTASVCWACLLPLGVVLGVLAAWRERNVTRRTNTP